MAQLLRKLLQPRFSAEKLKPHAKMAMHRFQIVNSKKATAIKAQKKEIAALLAEGKVEKARIRVEHLIRMDWTIEANEILAIMCELVHERVRYLAASPHCPSDMHEAICSLIWAANRAECPELVQIAKLFHSKFGDEFYETAFQNEARCVNERVLQRLSVQPPSSYHVQRYLSSIASEFGVDWEPEEAPAPDVLTGFSVPVAPGTDYGDVYSDPVPVSESEVSLAIPTTTTHVEPPAAPDELVSVPATVMPLPHELPPSHEDGLDALAPTCEKEAAALLPPSAVSLAPEVPETGGATVLPADASVAPATDVQDASTAPAPPAQPDDLFPPSPEVAPQDREPPVDGNPEFDALALRFAQLRK